VRERYLGACQIGCRDIDPSCMLRKTGNGNGFESHSPTWWFPEQLISWDSPEDVVDWMKDSSQLPNVESLIEVIRPADSSRWLCVDGYYNWEQPIPAEEERHETRTRRIWYMIKSYLVKREDVDTVYQWACKQDFMGRWMPETRELYKIFLGEFYWSPAYKYHNDPYERTIGWQLGSTRERIPKPIMPFCEGYMNEASGFDCSVDLTINIKLPNQVFVDKLELQWNGIEGNYFDKSGRLVVLDPSTTQSGPSVLLIERNALLHFLQQNDYAIIWTLLAEKDEIGASVHQDNWNGRMEISGAYRIQDGMLKGTMTPRFRERNSKG